MMTEQQEWRRPEETPPVPAGQEREFVLAVLRAHSGKVYTFGALYLNGLPLLYEDCRCAAEKDHHDGDGCPTTGWFTTQGDDEYAYRYTGLGLEKGDKIMGWREMPQWPSSDSVSQNPTEGSK